MGRSNQDLFCSSYRNKQTKASKAMASKLTLVLFGLIVFVALAAATEDNANGELSEFAEDSLDRVVREADADPKRRRKNKNKGKKNRKNKKQRKQRKNKNKKNGKRKGQRKGQRKGMRQGGRAVDDACVTNAVTVMKQWKDVVGNFEKQKTRMERQNKTGKNKNTKNGEFASVASYLVDIGGGNKSALSCSGSTTNSGAMQLTNLTKTLFDCEKDINATCNTANFPQPNMTFLDECVMKIDSFKMMAQECLDKTVGSKATTVADACTCWSNSTLTAASTAIKSCKASDESKAITKQLNKCKSAFGTCRKYEDDAISSIVSCSSSTSKLTAKAAQLSANSKAMTAAKTKMASLASSSGRRVARATATSCAEVITKSTELITISASSTSSTSLYTISIEISSVSSSVTCTTAEQASLSTQVTSLEEAIASVDSDLASTQSLLETLTGSTASTSSLTTAASTATSASSGRRERLVRDLIKNRM